MSQIAAVVTAASKPVAVPSPATWEPCHIDDLVPLLDISAAADLTRALMTFPARLRLQIAMARCEVESLAALARAAGLVPPEVDCRDRALLSVTDLLRRWVSRDYRMPMGMGFRFARLFGVPAEVLCEGYTVARLKD